MIKNISQLSDQINERHYSFLCDNDSPIVDVKEFCFRVLAHIAKIEEKVKEIQAKKLEEEAAAAAQPEEVVSSVVEELVQP